LLPTPAGIDAYKPQVCITPSKPWSKVSTLLQSQDATTNPSLILAAAGKAGYARLIDIAVSYAKEKGGNIDAQVENAIDRLVSEIDGNVGRTWFGTKVIGIGLSTAC
jgi:hypothetical protein